MADGLSFGPGGPEGPEDNDPLAPLRALYDSAGSGSGDDPLAPVRALYESAGPTTLEGPAPAAARSSTRIAPDVARARREGESRALAGLDPLPSIDEAPLSAPRGAPPIGVTDPDAENDRLIDEALERERERVELPEGQEYASGTVDAFFGGAARRLGRITRKGAEFAKRIPLPPGGRQVRDAVVDLAPDALEGAADQNVPTGSTQETAANVGAAAAELGAYIGVGGAGVKTANAVLRNPRIWSLFGADLAASLPLTAALEVDPETSVTESVAKVAERIPEDSPARPITELVTRAAQSPSGRIAFGAAVDLIAGGLVTAGTSKLAARREARAIADELAQAGVVSDRAHQEALDAARTPIDVDEAAESAGQQATDALRAQRAEAEADEVIRAHDRETRRLRGPRAGDRPPRTDADRTLDRELEDAADVVERVRSDVQPSRPRSTEPEGVRPSRGDLPSQADIGTAVEREGDALPDAYEAARRRLDEGGGVPVGAVAHLASAGAGAGLGAAIGETPEERLRNAVLFAAGAALAPTLVRRAAERFRAGERIAMEAGQPVAAVKLADGTIRTGQSHADIVVGLPEGYRFSGDEVDGFLTNRGRFVDRDEAGALEGIARGAFTEDVARGADAPTSQLRGPDAPAASEPRGRLRGPQGEDAGAYDAADFLRTKLGETGLDAPTERLFRDEFERATAATGTRRVRVSDDEVTAAARSIGQDPDEVARMLDERGLDGAEQLALMSTARENTRRMGEALRRLGSGLDEAGDPLTSEARAELQREVSRRADLNNTLLSKWATEGSEAGRTLRARQLEAAAVDDPVAMIERARQSKRRGYGRGADLDDVEQARVVRLVNEGETDELAEYMLHLEQPSPLSKLFTMVKANMLSLPQTHGVNIASNILKTVAWPIERAFQSLADRAIAWRRGSLTGEKYARTTVAGRADIEGLKGFREAPGKAGAAYRYSVTGKLPEGRGREVLESAERATAHRTDVHRRFTLRQPGQSFRDAPARAAVETYTNAVLGALGAEDVFFRHPAKIRSLYEQAIIAARREGLDGDALTRRVEELVAEPTAAMEKRAVKDSDESVFMDASGFFDGVDKLIQRAKRGDDVVGGINLGAPGTVLAETTVPFTRTLLGIADQVTDLTGLGLLRGGNDVRKLVKFAKANRLLDPAVNAEHRVVIEQLDEMQKQAAKRLGRGALGGAAFTGAVMLGGVLAEEGKIKTRYPQSQRQRELWRAQDIRPNSILIDGKWRQADFLGPYGLALMIGAYGNELLNAPDDERDGALQEAVEFTTALTESILHVLGAVTIAQGVETISDLAEGNEGSVERYLENVTRMPFPNILRGVERVADPMRREADYRGVSTEPYAVATPGLSDQFQPRVDALGREIEGPRGVWANIFSPSRGARPDRRESDPLLAELDRLGTVPIRPRRSTVERWANEAGTEFSREDWHRVQVSYGRAMERLTRAIMADPGYTQADDERRIEVLEREWTKAKTRLGRQLKAELNARARPRLRGPRARTGTGG